MKNKYFIALFLFSLIIVIIGALFKITHFKIGIINANMLLTFGMLAEVFVITLFIFKTVLNKKDNFLNK